MAFICYVNIVGREGIEPRKIEEEIYNLIDLDGVKFF